MEVTEQEFYGSLGFRKNLESAFLKIGNWVGPFERVEYYMVGGDPRVTYVLEHAGRRYSIYVRVTGGSAGGGTLGIEVSTSLKRTETISKEVEAKNALQLLNAKVYECFVMADAIDEDTWYQGGGIETEETSWTSFSYHEIKGIILRLKSEANVQQTERSEERTSYSALSNVRNVMMLEDPVHVEEFRQNIPDGWTFRMIIDSVVHGENIYRLFRLVSRDMAHLKMDLKRYATAEESEVLETAWS